MKCERCGEGFQFEDLSKHWQSETFVCERCYEAIDEAIYRREFEDDYKDE